MLKNLTTIYRVGAGFAMLTLVLIATVGVTLWQMARTQAITDKLINQSVPISDHSLRVINGVNYSVSQLRGWMLLPEERFKSGRLAAYSEWTDPSLKELKRLIEEVGNTAQGDQLRIVDVQMTELKGYQQQVEDLVRTEKNLPAHDLMQSRCGPKGDEILDAMGALIDEESKLEDTVSRKLLLYRFANFRGSFARALASLNQFLATGKAADREKYLRAWAENSRASDQVEASADLLQDAEPQQWARVKLLRSEFEPMTTKILEIRSSDQWDLALAILRDNAASRAKLVRDTLQKFITDRRTQDVTDRQTLLDSTSLLSRMEWLLLGVGMTISVVLATVIIRSVRHSIASVLASTQEVSMSSGEIAAGSQQQVSSLNETAASLNQITATAEEFKATMQEFADRAKAVQEAATETSHQSAEGLTLTRDAVGRFELVRTNAQAAGESVLNLAEQMQRIGEITATVHEIAEQTKLLALNASIEAARAGDQGRGFAVVATQVRELANQSKEAARRIESLVGGAQKSMRDVASKIEDGSRLAEESSDLVRQVTQSFEDIARAIEQTTAAMSQINTGARQQEKGISELVSSITEIDSASKESLASAEQTKKAILSIDRQIQRLNQTMAAF